MAKIPTSNYANDQTFTCSVPAEVLAGEYPYKVILHSNMSFTDNYNNPDGFYYNIQGKSQATLLVQSKFPIFIVKKTVGSVPLNRLGMIVSSVTKFAGYDATAEQYYMALYINGVEEDNHKFTVAMNFNREEYSYMSSAAPEQVTIFNAKITASGVNSRMAFYKNVVDGTYHNAPRNGRVPAEKNISGEKVLNGDVRADNIDFYADGETSETTASRFDRLLMADRYYAGSGLYTGAPLSAPSFQVLSNTFGNRIAFMNHSGTGTHEWDVNDKHYVNTLKCTISSTLSEIDNPSFETIADWYSYCQSLE